MLVNLLIIGIEASPNFHQAVLKSNVSTTTCVFFRTNEYSAPLAAKGGTISCSWGACSDGGAAAAVPIANSTPINRRRGPHLGGNRDL
jgi:hypothetical protein